MSSKRPLEKFCWIQKIVIGSTLSAEVDKYTGKKKKLMFKSEIVCLELVRGVLVAEMTKGIVCGFFFLFMNTNHKLSLLYF